MDDDPAVALVASYLAIPHRVGGVDRVLRPAAAAYKIMSTRPPCRRLIYRSIVAYRRTRPKSSRRQKVDVAMVNKGGNTH